MEKEKDPDSNTKGTQTQLIIKIEGDEEPIMGTQPLVGQGQITFKDVNDSFAALNNMNDNLTTETIAQFDRPGWKAKTLELLTAIDTYDNVYEEFDQSQLPKETKDKWAAQQTNARAIGAKLKALLETSKFHIADSKLKLLKPIYKQITQEHDKLTPGYLVKASITELQTKRSELADLASRFNTEYGLIHAENLEEQEAITLLEEKLHADSLTQATDKALSDSIQGKSNPLGEDNVKPGPSNQNNQSSPEELLSQTHDVNAAGKIEKEKQILEELKQAFLEQLKGEQTAHNAHLQGIRQELQSMRENHAERETDAEQKLGELERKFEVHFTTRGPATLEDEEKPSDHDDDGDEAQVGLNSGAKANGEAVVQLKLDTIRIPYFNGDLTEWISFKDLFESLVHTNGTLSDTVKFHQLKNHLKGVALDTIRGYQTSGVNYKAAWNDLKKRFDRKNEIVQEYIRRFLEVPAILHKATYSNLRMIVDTTNQMLRALPGQGVAVKDWDPFINFIIDVKLDEDTRMEWKTHIGRKDKMTVKELLEFLETRAVEIQPTQGDRLSKLLNGDNKKTQGRRIFQINQATKGNPPSSSFASNRPKCEACSRTNHNLSDCFKFKLLKAKEKTEHSPSKNTQPSYAK